MPTKRRDSNRIQSSLSSLSLNSKARKSSTRQHWVGVDQRTARLLIPVQAITDRRAIWATTPKAVHLTGTKGPPIDTPRQLSPTDQIQ